MLLEARKSKATTKSMARWPRFRATAHHTDDGKKPAPLGMPQKVLILDTGIKSTFEASSSDAGFFPSTVSTVLL